MGGHRRRSKGKAESEDEDNAVIVLSSSDDEEANRDLSLEIVERSRQREAKRKQRPQDGSGASVSHPVIDLSSTSSEELDAITDLGAGARAAESGGGVMPPPPTEEEPRKKKKRKSKKKKKKEIEENEVAQVDAPVEEEEPLGTADSVVTEANEEADDAVLRKLLRGPRYFDMGNKISESCYNCGEEGHLAVNCTMEKRQKPCFVCGMFGHNAKQCTQGQDCYICKRRGHLAKKCPDKHKQIAQDSKICLQCGDVGHDMTSCKNNYSPDDLKEIQCYICKDYGHLCCSDFTFPGPKGVSCYNCAQFGHTGLGCAKQHGETSAVAVPVLCYKCGEEGHFARGCTTNTKFNHWKGEPSTPTGRFLNKNSESRGVKSVPHDIRKGHEKKSMRHEDRRSATTGKSRVKGGWLVDDPGDRSKTNPKANGWASPRTPVRKGPKVHSVASDRPFSSSQSPYKKHKTFGGTYSQHGSTASSQHGYSASRYGSSQGRSWRTWQ